MCVCVFGWVVVATGSEIAIADWPVAALVHHWSKERVRKLVSQSGDQPCSGFFGRSGCVAIYWQPFQSIVTSSGAVSVAGGFSCIHSFSIWEISKAPAQEVFTHTPRTALVTKFGCLQ